MGVLVFFFVAIPDDRLETTFDYISIHLSIYSTASGYRRKG
jgi:hypothetical protein